MIILLILLTGHFIGDFVFQSNWMALNKSKRWDALAVHVFTYSAVLLWAGFWFWLVTFVLHFITDAITSRITSRLWFVSGGLIGNCGVCGDCVKFVDYDDAKRHWFFVMIGFDQLIHAWCLGLTWWLLKGGL